jgi:DNA/RNA endonuclease YhcR with UshA esterase domain
MNIKKISIAILILGSIGAIVAYKMYNKPHVNVSEVSVDITITAAEILKDFTMDENVANAIYLEKIIEVTGVISDIKIEKEKGIIALQTNDDFGNVLAHLSVDATKEISSLKEGQTVTLKGICTGYLMDVILIKCEIIN